MSCSDLSTPCIKVIGTYTLFFKNSIVLFTWYMVILVYLISCLVHLFKHRSTCIYAQIHILSTLLFVKILCPMFLGKSEIGQKVTIALLTIQIVIVVQLWIYNMKSANMEVLCASPYVPMCVVFQLSYPCTGRCVLCLIDMPPPLKGKHTNQSTTILVHHINCTMKQSLDREKKLWWRSIWHSQVKLPLEMTVIAPLAPRAQK